MTDAACIFCLIASGEVPADVIRQDDHFLAFRDVQPRADTHALVIPIAHHDDLDAWIGGGGSGDAMLAFVAAVAADLGVSGRYRLVTNVGEDAGQVVRHLHWHVMSGRRLPGF